MFFLEKSAIFVFAVVFFLSASTTVNFSLSASSGDKDFDLTLNSINIEAQKSMPVYYSSMKLHFGATSSQLDYLIYNRGLSPADAFAAFRLSILLGKPVETVLRTYTVSKKKGWGAMAKELGIKPGSPEFHQLKKGGVIVLEENKKQTGSSINVQFGNSSCDDKKHSGSSHKVNGKGGKKK